MLPGRTSGIGTFSRRKSPPKRSNRHAFIVIAILLAVPWSDPDFEAQIALARAVNDAQCRLVALICRSRRRSNSSAISGKTDSQATTQIRRK
jgi:hypothetical protein